MILQKLAFRKFSFNVAEKKESEPDTNILEYIPLVCLKADCPVAAYALQWSAIHSRENTRIMQYPPPPEHGIISWRHL